MSEALFSTSYQVARSDYSSAGKASADIKKRLKQLGIGGDVLRRVAVASYEVELNLVIHSEGGTLTLSVYPDRVELVSVDVGPGIPDLSMAMREGWPIGGMADVKDDWRDNAKTFAGYYGAIIQRYRAISPDAKFFLLTMPVMPDRPAERVPLEEEHTRLVHAMAARFDKTYVIDLRKYAPVYDAAFKEAFFLNGHLNPCGYILTAKMVMSYMDYIIRHNMDDFREAGLIGTPFKNVRQGDRA